MMSQKNYGTSFPINLNSSGTESEKNSIQNIDKLVIKEAIEKAYEAAKKYQAMEIEKIKAMFGDKWRTEGMSYYNDQQDYKNERLDQMMQERRNQNDRDRD